MIAKQIMDTELKLDDILPYPVIIQSDNNNSSNELPNKKKKPTNEAFRSRKKRLVLTIALILALFVVICLVVLVCLVVIKFTDNNNGYKSNRDAFYGADACGVVYYDNNLAVKIIGGKVANEKSWPWMTFITFDYIIPEITVPSTNVVLKNYSYSFTCGGTLINRYTVLTAAHCVYNKIDIDFGKFGTSKLELSYQTMAQYLRVYLGISNVNYIVKTGQTPYGTRMSVAKIVVVSLFHIFFYFFFYSFFFFKFCFYVYVSIRNTIAKHFSMTLLCSI